MTVLGNPTFQSAHLIAKHRLFLALDGPPLFVKFVYAIDLRSRSPTGGGDRKYCQAQLTPRRSKIKIAAPRFV